MLKDEIMDIIDNADKQELDDMTHTEIGKSIQADKELREYYEVSLRLKDKVPEVDLWERFQERQNNKIVQPGLNWKKWAGASAVAVLLLTAGLFFLPAKSNRKYSYTHLLENDRSMRVMSRNEVKLEEYKEQSESVLDYYYEIATL